jgi:long-chain acyl-CoA synthetase
MAIDLDLYRRSVTLPARPGKAPVTLSAIVAGPPEALRTLVFIHGFGGRAAYWNYQLDHFSEENRVVALDLRGHGLSDAPHSQYNIEELVEDVYQALQLLEVPQKFILIAHSFGGAVSSYFMNKYPGRVEKLVLIASAVQFKLRWVGRTLLKAPTPLLQVIQRYVPRARIYPPAHVVSAWNRNALSVWDGTEYLKKVNAPALVILGQRDLLFRVEAYQEVGQLIPGAQVVTIPVSAHQVMVERPDALNRAIDRFIGPAPLSEERERRRRARRELERTRPWLKFYDSRTPYWIDPPSGPVPRALEFAARRYPNRAALVFYDKPISYKNLERQCNRFANGLKKIGLKSGERVLLLLPNTPQAVIAYYGTLKAQGVAVFSNPLFNKEELLAQLKDCGATMVVCLSLFYPMVKAVAEEAGIRTIIVTSFKEYMGLSDRTLFRLLREKQEGHQMPRSGGLQRGPLYTFSGILRRGGTHIPDPAPAITDLAVIQYTSGTTGAPTGIMLTHANLVSNALQIRHIIPEARPGEEVILGVLPFSHSYGLTGCINFAPLLGATLVILPNFVTREVLEAIERYRPTLFPGVPQMYLNIANYPGVRKYGVASIRACISGGSPLAVEVQEAFEKLTKGRLVEGYGLTEASPVTHANPLSARRRAGSIGIPLPDTEAKIIDLRTGEDLPPGSAGELLVRGPQVMQGYWNRPQDTARALQNGWLHTGDVARMDEDGYFYIIDRKKDMIMAGDYNVYPRDIEEVLYEHPKVLDVAVVGVPTKTEPEKPHLKAYVVLREGERATAEELLALCRQRLKANEIPSSIEFLPELPRNFLGKILRRVLAEREN